MLKDKRLLIAFLLMLSLVLTTGTFAYWATNVEGTKSNAESTLTIGSAKGVVTEFEIANEYSSGGYLVPTNQLNNSLDKAVDIIYINHDVKWQEESELSQIEGVEVIGQVNVDYKVVIEQDGVKLPQNKYSEVYDLVNVEFNDSNKEELLLKGNTETYNYSVTLTEPSNQYLYNLISQSNIKIVFEYVIQDRNININTDSQEIEEKVSAFTFNQGNVVYIEVGTQFTDPGVIAYDSNGDEIDVVWLNNYPNTFEVGTYKATYGAYSELDDSIITSDEITFVVVDTEAPVIHLNGSDTVIHQLGVEYSDYYGAWASDNSYDDIEVIVEGIDSVDYNTPGEYTITYIATDAYDNTTSVTRTIIVK